VGPRAVLDAAVKRKIPSPRRKSNLKTPIVQPIAQRYMSRGYKHVKLYFRSPVPLHVVVFNEFMAWFSVKHRDMFTYLYVTCSQY
jgi:hypothetical protein